MKIFKLPDLGEGLPDAIIREWYVNEGDTVTKDQPIVSMETAKALVDVPAPFDCVIAKRFGDIDETIETGMPLIGFEGDAEVNEEVDSGTVVGKIEQSNTTIANTSPTLTPSNQHTAQRVKATPAVRALARQLQVDLNSINPAGERITQAEVKSAAQNRSNTALKPTPIGEKLSPAKQAMLNAMQLSHQQIVPVTLMDDADITAWYGSQDITVRLIQAITIACQKEPILNAHFHSDTARIEKKDQVNLGIAIDMPHGLYVPVIQAAEKKSGTELRNTIEQLKQQAQSKTLPPEQLRDASIVLSNFGAIAGRYANPIITPPNVAIIGIGKIYFAMLPNEHHEPTLRRMLPISITIDHRAITGGEAARFLSIMQQELLIMDNTQSR